MQKPDRRVEPRVDVDLEVHYRTAQEFIAAYLRNISGGGIFIRTQQPLPLNQQVQVRLNLPAAPRPLTVRGLVVWTTPYPSRSSFPSGMGVKFLNLDPEAEKIIAGFIKDKLSAHPPAQKPSGPEPAGGSSH
jgi:uncharacterized protein (TIGR02266 family)